MCDLVCVGVDDDEAVCGGGADDVHEEFCSDWFSSSLFVLTRVGKEGDNKSKLVWF